VSDLPDFATLYDGSFLSPRMAARLWSVAEIIYDDALAGAAADLMAQLPPIAQLHADQMFTSAFISRFAVIAKRIAHGLTYLEAIATCTADEMAVHVIITYAEQVYNGRDPQWINDLPARPDEDYAFDSLPELLLQDDDVLMLYNPALDGIEDAGEEYSECRFVNLHPNEWFDEFPCFRDGAPNPTRAIR
jgi:hypothetical protein